MSVFSLKLDISDNRYFNGKHSPLFSREEAHKALKFHEKITGYHPTPLYDMKDLAALFGVRNILVKDESQRFDLNAFKILAALMLSPTCCAKSTTWILTISLSRNSKAP